jgi:uncharacterized protein YdaU (DUF1376 family)
MEWNGSSPPAFQLYARDWLIGTRTLPPEARGVYIDLLCLSWDLDGIPSNSRELLPHLAISRARWNRIWPLIEDKFPLAEEGKRRNPRQERLRQEWLAYHRKRVSAGRKGGKARAAKEAS